MRGNGCSNMASPTRALSSEEHSLILQGLFKLARAVSDSDDPRERIAHRTRMGKVRALMRVVELGSTLTVRFAHDAGRTNPSRMADWDDAE